MIDWVFMNVNVSIHREYMRDVISGLQSLHDKFIAHADIKMKNILISDKNVAKIAGRLKHKI